MSPSLFRPPAAPPFPSRAGQLSALPLSIGVHVLVLLAVVVIPLLATDALPLPYQPLTDWMPVVAPPTPPPPSVPATRRVPQVAVDESRGAPVNVPEGVREESSLVTEERMPTGLEGDRGVIAGSITGAAGLNPVVEPPPPPPPPKIHRVSDFSRPVRRAYVQPDYPELARQAHVEGIVIIDATISATGDVIDARVLRSQPLLDEAALAAVRQWKFTPTVLNGVPVPVVLTVTVRFSLH